ncbi:hypothetical protein E2C01_082508 [Portunus trituberculatus]|uniref:Uncharacterized protein n=1 Tax=Portunus trituberculatus TaxID=210409 RepID=A0A5B7J1W1_PORTR|nr:hypothetical protein [Portunus trituberculatus]
MTSFLCLAR